MCGILPLAELRNIRYEAMIYLESLLVRFRLLSLRLNTFLQVIKPNG